MYNWFSLIGDFEQKGRQIIFKGGTSTDRDGRQFPNVGNFLSDQYFSSGEISAKVTLTRSVEEA